MRVVADANIPLLDQLLPGVDIRRLPGRSITPSHLRDADALLVRSVTPVNRQLLEGTSVRFVGSATSGIDHVSESDLAGLGIRFASASGANARTVVEYVIAVLTALDYSLERLSIGLVGCGAVGGRLYRLLDDLGCRVMAYDPFLEAGRSFKLTDLNSILNCDVVSLHTPLTDEGPYPTRKMIGMKQLERLRPGSLLINTARGGVLDETALLSSAGDNNTFGVVLDVWQDEPFVPGALMQRARLMTPHIAGYSRLAKERGARLVAAALRKEWGEGEVPGESAEPERHFHAETWQEAVSTVLNPVAASDELMKLGDRGENFDRLRQLYGERLEFSQVSVSLPKSDQSIARKLGFFVA